MNPPVIQILIEFDPRTGGLKLTGPIGNKIMMYGILELAKDCVANPERGKDRPGIVIAEPGEKLPPPPKQEGAA
jgi:hypothetical protein